MSTHEQHTTNRAHRWVTPLVAIGIGVAYLVAGGVGGNTTFMIVGPIVMFAVAALFVVLSCRSETVAGLMDRRDERINAIDASASLFAGMTVLVAVIVMFVFEVARGHDGSPYAALGALGGVAYLAALVWGRFRR